MVGRIVEIASDNRYLSVKDGFLVVSHEGAEVARTPIDDVLALIGNSYGLSYSNNLLVALANRGCPFVLCGSNHRPVGILWPIEGHHRIAARLDAQMSASAPMRKRAWRQLVRSKLAMQAAVLDLFSRPSAPLRRLVGKVRSGDPSNIEGQGARNYWRLLFGEKFRRDPDAPGINGLLNYGYTVLRAVVARHLIAAGLHPNVPLHHANESNSMRLVDDVMEPYRPLVDAWVHRLVGVGTTEVNSDAKHALGRLPVRSIRTERGTSPVSLVVQRTCVSLARYYESELNALELPKGERRCIETIWDEWEGSEDRAGN